MQEINAARSYLKTHYERFASSSENLERKFGEARQNTQTGRDAAQPESKSVVSKEAPLPAKIDKFEILEIVLGEKASWIIDALGAAYALAMVVSLIPILPIFFIFMSRNEGMSPGVERSWNVFVGLYLGIAPT